MKNPNGYGSITKMGGKRRNPYRVRITCGWELVDNKVKQLRKTLGYYPTKKAAMMALAEYNKNPYDVDAQSITFDDLFQQWFAEHQKKYPSTVRGIRGAYAKCEPLYKMKMVDVRKSHMQGIMNANAAMSKSSQRNLKTVFKNVFRLALENDVVQKDYSEFVDVVSEQVVEEKEPFTKAEIQAIFDNLDLTVEYPIGGKQYAELKLMDTIVVLLYTGMRIGELLNIKSSDVHLDEKYIDLQGTKTKAAKRIVPLHEKIIPIIKERLEQGGKYLFSNVNGEQFRYNQYKKNFYDPTMKDLKIEKTPHAARHTFVSGMQATDVRNIILKRIVGHSDSDVTEHYTHVDVSQLLEAVNKLEY